jgi:hypothetical protein
MKPKAKAARTTAAQNAPAGIQVGFTLDQRDRLDRVKGRAHALIVAALTLHDHGDEVNASNEDTDKAIGYLLEMAGEHLETINETFAAADARGTETNDR